jgi:hypothetical protein
MSWSAGISTATKLLFIAWFNSWLFTSLASTFELSSCSYIVYKTFSLKKLLLFCLSITSSISYDDNPYSELEISELSMLD